MSNIEWTDVSWNPIRAIRDGEHVGWHCERVSPGCQNCYAERRNVTQRLGWGTGLPYNRKSRDMVTTYLDEDTLVKPLRWRTPRRVFVCSMTDLFGEWVPFETIGRIFEVMAQTPQHTYQILTKRPQRMLEAVEAIELAVSPAVWPLPNVWLGCSVEDQQRADERIPVLLDTPAAVRFLSCEPLLSHVDISLWTTPNNLLQRPGIDWVIVGGESGPGARPFDLQWARDIRDQCSVADVAFFMKQVGSSPVSCGGDPERMPVAEEDDTEIGIWRRYKLRSRHGSDMAEWPEDLRIREFPGNGGTGSGEPG